GPDMEAGRAKSTPRHRMAPATRTTPPSRSSAFRNLDRQIGRRCDRHRHDGRIGDRRNAETQRGTDRNCTYIPSIPSLFSRSYPLHRFKIGAAEPSIEDAEENDRMSHSLLYASSGASQQRARNRLIVAARRAEKPTACRNLGVRRTASIFIQLP